MGLYLGRVSMRPLRRYAHSNCDLVVAVQKQPAAGALLSDLLLTSLKTQQPPIPIVPQYLVRTKEAVEPNSTANASLR